MNLEEMQPEAGFLNVRDFDSTTRKFYSGAFSRPSPDDDNTAAVVDFIFEISRSPAGRSEHFNNATVPWSNTRHYVTSSPSASRLGSSDVQVGHEQRSGVERGVEMERRIQRAIRSYNDCFPLSIWNCCVHCCFSFLAADPTAFMVFDEVLRIHEVAESLHAKIGSVEDLVPTRRRWARGSNVAFVVTRRAERELDLCRSAKGHSSISLGLSCTYCRFSMVLRIRRA